MGLFAQIIGTLGMFAGVVAAAFGFTLVGSAGFFLLPYGIGLFVSGMLIVCLGLIVEHIYGLRKAQEKQLELLQSLYSQKVG